MQFGWTTSMDKIQVSYNTKLSFVHTYIQMSCPIYRERLSVDVKINLSFLAFFPLEGLAAHFLFLGMSTLNMKKTPHKAT